MGGVSPISLSDILAYLQLFGTDDEEFFVAVICKVDTLFLKNFVDKADAKSKAASKFRQ